MAVAETANSEGAILDRVLQPERADFTPEVARAILAWDFPQTDQDRMHELVVRNQDGQLTEAERRELDSYRRVGRLLDLLSSKARRAPLIG